MNELDKALDQIDIDLLESLEYGEEIKLTDRYTLYHYMNDEVIVLVVDDGYDWSEFLQILWSEGDYRIDYEVVDSNLMRQEENR